MPIYMKIEGVDGESRNEAHRNWFDVYSFNWGEAMALGTGGGAGGGSTGKIRMNDFAVAKPSGKGSPKLFLWCASGHHIPAVQIEVTQFRGDVDEVIQRYKLENCMITTYDTSGDDGSIPTETLSLNFDKITFMQRYFVGNNPFQQEAFWDKRNNTGGGGD